MDKLTSWGPWKSLIIVFQNSFTTVQYCKRINRNVLLALFWSVILREYDSVSVLWNLTVMKIESVPCPLHPLAFANSKQPFCSLGGRHEQTNWKQKCFLKKTFSHFETKTLLYFSEKKRLPASSWETSRKVHWWTHPKIHPRASFFFPYFYQTFIK